MAYTAKSLEDIAKAFDHHAWQATAFSDRLHKTQQAKRLAERESQTWKRAAQMIRETTLENNDCGQCEGTGSTDTMGHEEECPVCDGSGKLKGSGE